MSRIKTYQTFGEIWQQHLHSYRAFFCTGIFPMQAEDDANEATLDTTVHLPEWPARRLDSASIDILVHARETFSLERPPKILASTVKVTYWHVDGKEKTAEPLSTIHYDYGRTPVAGHPIYHSQCCVDPISDTPLPPSWKYTPAPTTGRRFYPFRVPTPHMCLCGVLVGLVADHLPWDHLRKLLDAIKKNGWVPPLAAHCRLWNLSRGEAIHNWQWYFWPD